MRIEELRKYKNILILGYGIEGRATHAFLRKYVPNANILIGDQKYDPNYLDLQKKADLAIRTPFLPKEKIYIPYTTATNIFFANINNKTIGVTGTKGKSTTASLIHAILLRAGIKSVLAGNIGKPLLGEILIPQSKKIIFIIELSSYQLDDIKFSPNIGCILNIYPEHLDYHGGLREYLKAKSNIVRFCTIEDHYIYNERFDSLKKISTKARKHKFLKLSGEIKPHFLLGDHNIENIRAAYTVSKKLGIQKSCIKQAVSRFKPLKHRLENIGTYGGIVFVDDAASSNPQSAIEAINTIAKIGTIILGGLDRGYDFSSLAKSVREKKINNIILFPNSGKRIKKEIIKAVDYSARFYETDSISKAVKFAYKNTKSGMVCLLSTGCPSYTMFSGFIEKGEEFKKFVMKYGSCNSTKIQKKT